MIKPDIDRARGYIESASESELVDSLVFGDPWLFASQAIDFRRWSQDILAAHGFGRTSSLHLVGSAATGFSLAPSKPGAAFRELEDESGPSDLDFALVDANFFVEAWNSMLIEDTVYGPKSRPDYIRCRIYWGRIEQSALPQSQRPRARKIVDSIRRFSACRGHLASIRLYRRTEDLVGYSRWCIRQLRKEVGV